LRNQTRIIYSELEKEGIKFGDTLEKGVKEFEKSASIYISWNKEKPKLRKKELPGQIVFRLYETYGFPVELTEEIAKEKGLTIDKEGFNEDLKKHQDISRAGVSGFKSGLVGESEITTRMHTATHLLLKALQEVLGKDVHQRGSNINEERIRFDFSYPKPMTEEEIKKVENIVNQKIAEDIPVVKKETTIEEAKKLGAEAQFLNKYGVYAKLTMYSIGDYSHELCGGPHVKSTSEIGKFKIIKEESSSAGVRRIRAILEP
jgi:alanyl-tRNA synthetase